MFIILCNKILSKYLLSIIPISFALIVIIVPKIKLSTFMNESQNLKLASSREFQFILKNIHEDMLLSEQKGDYVEADNLRQRALVERKRWEQMTLNDMGNRHAQQVNNLEKEYHQDVQKCNQEWSEKIEKFIKTSQEQASQTDKKNKKECEELKKRLNQQLPTKVKESHDLLNLREMQRHMSKQKDFTQAHLIQQRIKQVYEKELQAWNQGRSAKIQQALANLKAKHAAERELFNKRNQIHLQDQNNRWRQEKISLQQRFQNALKEMKASQQREKLSFSRSFKTKGGVFSQRYDERLDD